MGRWRDDASQPCRPGLSFGGYRNVGRWRLIALAAGEWMEWTLVRSTLGCYLTMVLDLVGRVAGARVPVFGEVVFNTAMAGYP